MSLFFPEWIPLWLQLAIIAVVLIFGICFLLMPFSVFGLKSRLTYLDHQMEDIQAQLRVLLKRIPDARDRMEYKLQPVSTTESTGNRNENVRKEQGLPPQETQIEPPYRPRPVTTRFDPPQQAVEQSKSNLYTENQYSDQNRPRERGTVFVKDQRMTPIEENDQQLYNPPHIEKEDRHSEVLPRRRAEPILRWPPK